MLKAAQRSKPDLVNWPRPTLRVNRKPEFERRSLKIRNMWPWLTSYESAVAPSRRNERNSLWRDAGDARTTSAMTGRALQRTLRMRLDQFKWSKGFVTLCATKTENERELPIWDCVRNVVQRRIDEDLTDDDIFSRGENQDLR